MSIRLLAVLTMAVLALLVLGCKGEDRPGVTTIGTPSESVSGPPLDGIVLPKPAGASEVDVELKEWGLTPSVSQVKQGTIYFLVTNAGPDDVHELQIYKTDLAADKLLTKDGKALGSKDVVKVAEVHGFAAKSQASGLFVLKPGKYVLLCNIAAVEEGALESHYQLGMRAGFTVTN